MESQSLPQTHKALLGKEDDKGPRIEDIPLPKPGQNQVLVKVAFVPINPSDILCMNGFYRFSTSPPFLVGREASGTVFAVGENLKRPFKVGDRVYVHPTGGGTHAQYVIAETEDVATIAEDITFEEAASHIINPGTVAHMAALTQRGGHKAAINTAASSALGRMFIRYFKEKGLKTINVVRNEKYIDELKKEGADYVLNSEAPDFEQKLKEIAEKEQAKIAFDAIGTLAPTIVKNQPPNSICYQYGFLGGAGFQDFGKELGDGKKIDFLMYLDYVNEFKNKGEIDKYYEEIHSRLKTTFKTNVQKVFPLEKFFEALDFYEKNTSQGKVLIKPN